MIPVKPRRCQWCWAPEATEPILTKSELGWRGKRAPLHAKCPQCGLTAPGADCNELLEDHNGNLTQDSAEIARNIATRQWNRLQDLIAAGKLVME